MTSPRFCTVAATGPSSAPVRREKVATSGVRRSSTSILAGEGVGGLQRGAGGEVVVDHEGALVHRGEEAGRDERGDEVAEPGDGDEREGGERGPPHQRAHQGAVDLAGRLVGGVLLGEPDAGRQGHQHQRDEERDQHGRGDGEGERAEEVADNAVEEGERDEDHHGGQRGADHRGRELDRAVGRGVARALAQALV